MENFVVDTNFFFNLEIKSGFGQNPKQIIIKFAELASQLKTNKKAEFFVPPRIVDEFHTFVEPEVDYGKNLISTITVKSPHISSLQFPATVFYKLVEEIRERSYRGLRIAEESVDAGAQKVMGAGELSRIDYQKTVGDAVAKLRERYRQATRFNFLDSVADLDLIVLSREMDAFLVSSDEGVMRWGREFGVKEVEPQTLLSRLEAL